MPKSKAKLKRKYVERYDALKKVHDDVCRKNAKYDVINKQYHLRDQQWGKENSFLRHENSLKVSKVMKLKKSLEDKDKEVIDLKREIEYLKEQLRRKEMKEIKRMKEKIPSDF